MRPSAEFLLLVLLAAILGAAGIANHGLWTADEPRVAEIGREMAESGWSAVPRLNGEPFLEKPPLYWWAQAAIFKAAGRATPGLARSASALFAFLTVLLTWALARRFLAPPGALLTCLILATSVQFMQRAHWVIVDTALVAASTGALACAVHALDRRGAGRTILLALAWLCLALAFLAKGVVGPAIPVIGLLAWAVWTGRVRKILSWHLLPGTAFVVGIAALWLWRVHAEIGSAGVEEFLIHNQFGRFFTSAADYGGGHQNPFWYYLGTLPVDFLPWTLLLIPVGIGLYRARASLDEGTRDAVRFGVAAVVPAFLALSVAGTKRGLYLLPVFPPLALLVATGVTRLPTPTTLWLRRLTVAAAGLVVGVAVLAGVGAAAMVFFPPHALLPSLLPAAVFALLAAALLHPRHPRTGVAAWNRRAALLVAGLASLLTAGLPVLDEAKSFAPFTAEVSRLVPADAALATIDPDETTLGIIGFETGRRLEEYETFEAFGAAAPRAPTWLVLRGRQDDEAEILDALRAGGFTGRVRAERKVGNRRVMRLVLAEPAE